MHSLPKGFVWFEVREGWRFRIQGFRVCHSWGQGVKGSGSYFFSHLLFGFRVMAEGFFFNGLVGCYSALNLVSV